MVTYIQKYCKEYIELESELSTEFYPIGSTLEDYKNGKWIKLTDEQLQFRQNNPEASKEEVINMKITPEPQPSEKDLLIEAKYNKEQEIFSKLQEHYVYNLDSTNIFTFNTLAIKDRCSRNKSIIINGKEISSDILEIALGEINDYSEKVQSNLDSIINSVRNCQSKEEVEAINSDFGYPEIINKTTEDLISQLHKINHNNLNYQAASLAKLMVNTVSMTNTQALEMQMLFPIWGQQGAEFGKEVEIGFRLRVVDDTSDVLYEVTQKHTLQEHYKPGTGTESLYKSIDVVHIGTKEDPIPYNNNMQLELGKYYSQNGVTYLCFRDTGQPVYNDLSALVDIYVKVAQ